MSEPWTPGPWEWSDERDYDFLPDHHLFGGLQWSGWKKQGDGKRTVIDRDRDTGYDGCIHDEAFIRITSANARLIALAPEMADYIQRVCELLVGDSDSSWEHEASDLLARARGENIDGP